MHSKLPIKYYFINKFDSKYLNNQEVNTGIIYRNYEKKIDLKLVLKIKEYCKKKKLKFFLSNNIRLALKLDLNGAYIPSFNNDTNHLSYSIKNEFFIIGSAHNNKEIKIKEIQKVKIIFLSSVFKKNKNYLGINKFNLMTKLTKKKIVALGGISSNNLKKLKLINYFGFAGITYFE